MTGFYAKSGETRNQTYKRIYGTDNALKQCSIKKQKKALENLKLNFYKRQIELSDASSRDKKQRYTHKSLDELLKRFSLKKN